MKRGFDVLRDKALNRSIAFAVSVATKAHEMDLARAPRPRNMRRTIEAMMYRP